MDENVDLTLEALFAREANPRLMLDGHFREHQQRTSPESGRVLIDPEYTARKITEMLTRMALPRMPEDFEADHEWLERHTRIFGSTEGERVHRQIDPWAFVHDGSFCDCCGGAINPLTRINNFGVCITCNAGLEERFGESELVTL